MEKEIDFLEITTEVASIYTFQSRESKVQYDDSKNHVALSPDGRFAAFFNTGTKKKQFVYKTRNK
jgi:hypothetical protein